MLPIVVRTSQEGLAVLVKQWLPSGRLHLRTDQEVAAGASQDTRLVLPDGREVLLYGKIEAVERDDRGTRVTVVLGPDNDAALEVLRKALAVDFELDLPSPRDPVPSVDMLLHGSGRTADAPEVTARLTDLPPIPDTPSPQLAPAGLTSAPPDERLVVPRSSPFIALAPPIPPPAPALMPEPPEVARAHGESPPPPVPRAPLAPPVTPAPERAASPIPLPMTPPPVPGAPARMPAGAAVAPPPPPPPPQVARRSSYAVLAAQSRLAADELANALTEIATMGLSDDRRRAAILRRAIDVVRPVEQPEALGELLARILTILPAANREDHASLERALLELVPAPALLRAATSLARQAPLLATVGGADAETRFEASARVVALAVAMRAKKLDADGQALLRALAESGSAFVKRMPPELWPLVAGSKYLRATRAEAEHALAPLEQATTAADYQNELTSLEPAMELLRHERCWEALAPLLTALARHRDVPRAAFAQRPLLAASMTDRFFAGNTLPELARAFSEAAGEARVHLLEILSAAGAPAAVQLVEILKRSSDTGLRKDALALLRTQSDATRRSIMNLLKGEEPEWSVLQNLLPILGEVGQDGDMHFIGGYREHAHMQVRRAALEGMAALGGRRAEPALLRGLDDKSRIVQVRALTLLGQVRSTDPNTLRYITELLKDTGAPDEDEDLICAGIEALALIGNVPLPDRVGTVEDLLVKTFEGTRRGALVRFVRGKGGGLWQRATVRRVLCSALGRIGLDDAEEALKKVAYDSADPVQRDADQAIFAIAARRRALGK